MPVENLPAEPTAPAQDEGPSLVDLALTIVQNIKLLLLAPLAAGLLSLGITYLMKPVFTARTTFLPPQQQGPALTALASLGALGGLAGGVAGLRSPIDQYVALLQSMTVTDRVIDGLQLMQAYDVDKRFKAQLALSRNARIVAGRKDGLITVEVDDHEPTRAAAIANRYVAELRRLTGELALTEAQQRRVFFERQLQLTKDKLTQAQLLLQRSGYSAGALKAEPRAAAERYARLQAEVTAAEVRLQTMREALVDGTPEVQRQQAQLNALRSQLTRAESPVQNDGDPDYVGKYRDFKYQETLFELFARQFEMARLDESREGALIQVVDTATAPERKSRPQRALIAVATTASTFVVLVVCLFGLQLWREASKKDPVAEKLTRLRATLGRG